MTGGGCPHIDDPTFDGVWCAACTPALTASDVRVVAAARALHEQQQTRIVERLERYTPQPWEGLAPAVRSQLCEEAVEIVTAIDQAALDEDRPQTDAEYDERDGHA